MNHTPTIIVFFLVTILAFGHKYNEILAAIILSGFLEIVVNSNKYPAIDNFINTVFFEEYDY